MIFDIGLFGGGEESGSFTQERFTDHEGDIHKIDGLWLMREKIRLKNTKILVCSAAVFRNEHDCNKP